MYEPLYPPEGAPCRGFRCQEPGCNRVTRTERGIRMHCHFVHHIKWQVELFNGETIEHVRPTETGTNASAGANSAAKG